jgi:hypothetical protein
MGEPELVAIDRHHRLDLGLSERPHHLVRRRVGGTRHQRHRGIGQAGHREQHVLGTDSADPRTDHVIQTARQAQPGGTAFGAEFPGQFQREKGIPARDFMNTQQRRPRDGPTQPKNQDLMQLANRQRPQPDSTRAIRAGQLQARRGLRGARRAHHGRPGRKPPCRIRHHARAGRVDPLQVVDRDQNRIFGGEPADDSDKRRRHRPGIDVVGLDSATQQLRPRPPAAVAASPPKSSRRHR